MREVLAGLWALSLFLVGCGGGSEKKPFATTSQSPTIPMPPAMKSAEPAPQQPADPNSSKK